MAEYDSRILVPYLQDVFCAEIAYTQLQNYCDHLCRFRRNCEKSERNTSRMPEMITVIAAIERQTTAAVQELQKVCALREELYQTGVIPDAYRTVEAAGFLYEWFANGRIASWEEALRQLRTETLQPEAVQASAEILPETEEASAEEMPSEENGDGLQTYKQLLLQRQQTAQTEKVGKNRIGQLRALARLPENKTQQRKHLAMIRGIARADAYFAAAVWLQDEDL